jgi:hypothetical protein
MVGQTLGHYGIGEQLGAGGCAWSTAMVPFATLVCNSVSFRQRPDGF